MKKPTRSLVLTDDERREYEKLKWLSHYDPVTEENTFGKYNELLRTWTDKLRKKHSLDEKESFFFH
jgi:hypothetical protein